MGVLSNLEPKEVFYYFEEICKIPHGSFHMEPISDYCVNFAKEHGLTYYQDEEKNVIIMKEATPGYENAPSVIIQGHLDMVCEKEEGCPIDFEKDGLALQIDGDLLLAKGTTLGGDDGIAVAYGLALLASDNIPHPKLEVVFTTNEEVGLTGAESIDLSMLESKILINLDSEEEGIFLTSCAGGLRANISIPVSRTKKEGMCYEISLQGMTGGHSGTEIEKGPGNSNILMGRLLYHVNQKTEIQLEQLKGGQKDNAIPRITKAVVLVEESLCEQFEEAVREEEAFFQVKQKTGDPNLFVELKKTGRREAMVLDRSSMLHALATLVLIPNGVQSMSMEIPGLVETSLNLGILELTEDTLKICSSVRSSLEKEKDFLREKLTVLAEYMGGSIEVRGNYPGWEYQPKSFIREVFTEAYRDLYGKEPQIQAIHAGLECGLLSGKIPGLDCIALGPDMSGVHTTEERLSISSTKRTWELLLEALKRMK